MTPFRFWIRVLGGVAGAIATVLWVDVPPPTDVRVPIGFAAGIGALGGTALFGLLARRRPRLPGAPSSRATVTQATFLVAWAVVEELAWRWLVLGAVAARAGATVGLVAATIGFALVHRGGRSTHVATGGVFGCVYLATGDLAAPIVAHAVYNLLVAEAIRMSTAEPRPA